MRRNMPVYPPQDSMWFTHQDVHRAMWERSVLLVKFHGILLDLFVVVSLGESKDAGAAKFCLCRACSATQLQAI